MVIVHTHCRSAELTTYRQKSLIHEKAISQQYLTPQEEKALIAYILQSAENSFPFPVKVLQRLALVIKRHCSAANMNAIDINSIKPPSKNWSQAFALHHPEINTRRLKVVN